MSMFNGIDWAKNGHYSECFHELLKGKKLRKEISDGLFSVLEMKKSGMERTNTNLKENGIVLVMVSNFEDSGHPVFRARRSLDRGFLKKDRWEMYDSLQR